MKISLKGISKICRYVKKQNTTKPRKTNVQQSWDVLLREGIGMPNDKSIMVKFTSTYINFYGADKYSDYLISNFTDGSSISRKLKQQNWKYQDYLSL